MIRIDLSCESTCPRYLNFNHVSVKHTSEGVEFVTYHGLRLYLITGSIEPQYLTDPKLGKTKHEWLYISDLKEQLEDALEFNIRHDLFLKSHFLMVDEFYYDDEVTPTIQMWLDVIHNVKKKMEG